MSGEPSDIDTECNARLFIGDNYGDGTATMRCQLAPLHEGLHKEEFARQGGVVIITWTIDERERCDHGCGQWNHAHKDAAECPRDAHDHEYSDCGFCNKGKEPVSCIHCAKSIYYVEGHLYECPKKPFTCAVCGKSGIGNHDWPGGCPDKQRAVNPKGSIGDLIRHLPHAMMGPPGHHCSCGDAFANYYALAEHVRVSGTCPQCGEAAALDLGPNEIDRWACGHWIARGDLEAVLQQTAKA